MPRKRKAGETAMRRCGVPLEGPWYDVALEKPGEPNAYKDIDHAEELADAKRLAEEYAAREGRRAIVWDNVEMEIVHRCGPQPQPAPQPPPRSAQGRRGSK